MVSGGICHPNNLKNNRVNMANQIFQKLTTLSALTSPVTPAQAGSGGLTSNMAALANCSVIYLKAISVVAMAFELNAYGGTNYVNPENLKQLRQDAASLFGGISLLGDEQNLQMVRIRASLDWAAAAAKVGASFTGSYSDVNAILAFDPKLLDTSLEMLDRMIFLLRYKLAVIGA